MLLPRQDALLFLRDFFTSLAANINPMVPAEAEPSGEGWAGSGGSGLPASQPALGPALVSVHPISPPAHPETPVQPSSAQEGQPEGMESIGAQEAAGSRHGASSEQQPIYFR